MKKKKYDESYSLTIPKKDPSRTQRPKRKKPHRQKKSRNPNHTGKVKKPTPERTTFVEYEFKNSADEQNREDCHDFLSHKYPWWCREKRGTIGWDVAVSTESLRFDGFTREIMKRSKCPFITDPDLWSKNGL